MYTIGADPEGFVYENGALTASIGRIGGTKENPMCIGEQDMFNTYVQEDNVLLEFNTHICPISRGVGSGSRFVAAVKNHLKDVRKYCKDRGLEFRLESSNLFSMQDLNKYGPAALEFGCDPDFNAYTKELNPAPDSNTSLRTAGGHLHLGMPRNEVSPDSAAAVARACDLFLGVPSVLMDEDVQRRTMYGKAGAYRPKSYGVEYRSLSNFWLRGTKYVVWAEKSLRNAAESYRYIDALVRNEWDTVISCINDSDQDKAKYLVNKFNLKTA